MASLLRSLCIEQTNTAPPPGGVGHPRKDSHDDLAVKCMDTACGIQRKHRGEGDNKTICVFNTNKYSCVLWMVSAITAQGYLLEMTPSSG